MPTRATGAVGAAGPSATNVLTWGAGVPSRTGAGHFAKHASPAGAPFEPSGPEAGPSSHGTPPAMVMGMSQGAFAATDIAAKPVTSNAMTASTAAARQAIVLRTVAWLLPFFTPGQATMIAVPQGELPRAPGSGRAGAPLALPLVRWTRVTLGRGGLTEPRDGTDVNQIAHELDERLRDDGRREEGDRARHRERGAAFKRHPGRGRGRR